MNDRHYELRSYEWKGEPHVAVWCDGRRLGVLKADLDTARDMAQRLHADLVELGEVRLAAEITVKRTVRGQADAPS